MTAAQPGFHASRFVRVFRSFSLSPLLASLSWAFTFISSFGDGEDDDDAVQRLLLRG